MRSCATRLEAECRRTISVPSGCVWFASANASLNPSLSTLRPVLMPVAELVLTMCERRSTRSGLGSGVENRTSEGMLLLLPTLIGVVLLLASAILPPGGGARRSPFWGTQLVASRHKKRSCFRCSPRQRV